MGAIAFIQHKNIEAPLRIITKPGRQHAMPQELHPLYRFLSPCLTFQL